MHFAKDDEHWSICIAAAISPILRKKFAAELDLPSEIVESESRYRDLVVELLNADFLAEVYAEVARR